MLFSYQVVRPIQLEQQSLVFASGSKPLLNELGFVLHQCNSQFEMMLEKRCRNPKWIEKHFFKEITAYKQRLKETFNKTLNKFLQQIEMGEEQVALTQQAEQAY